MTRPRSICRIGFWPKVTCFKPGKKGSGASVNISAEEAESMRLKNIKKLNQTTAAHEMGISQSTFQRLLAGAYKKVSEAIVFGKEILISHPVTVRRKKQQ